MPKLEAIFSQLPPSPIQPQSGKMLKEIIELSRSSVNFKPMVLRKKWRLLKTKMAGVGKYTVVPLHSSVAVERFVEMRTMGC